MQHGIYMSLEPEEYLSVGIVIVIIITICSAAYNAHDYKTGSTNMTMGVIVDKEHEIIKDDGSIIDNRYYFVVNQGGAEVRALVDCKTYRGEQIGNSVVIDTRVGGVSNKVVEVKARSFNGAEVAEEK